MQLDNILIRVLQRVGKKQELESEQVIHILEGMYEGISHCIHNKNASIIKIDFFGKFIFSEAWKKKKESLFGVINFKELDI